MLHHTFRDYLRAGATRAGAGSLAPLLAADRPIESAALAHYAAHGAGTFTHGHAQTVHVGPTLPVASFGDIWVDTAEVTAMMFVASYVDPDERDDLSDEAIADLPLQSAWLAMRPTARYQVAGFLAATGTERDDDSGDPFAPATGLTIEGARAYLSHFGKVFPTENHYLEAIERGLSLWGEPAREWTGIASFDESRAIAVNPNTLRTDAYDTEEERDPARRMLFPAATPAQDITFRSAVLTQFGLGIGRDRFVRPSAFTPAHIRRIAEALCQLERAEPGATIAATSLGGSFQENPTWVTVVAPPPGARVAKLAKRDGLVDTIHVELDPAGAPTRAALEAALGPGGRPPLVAPQPLYQVFHRITVANAPFTCAVIAQFGRDPGPDDAPHTIVFRRDRATGS